MQIARVQSYPVFVPYAAPVNPYRSRRQVTRGAASLVVRVETDDGAEGWGEGTGRLPEGTEALLAGIHPCNMEAVLAILGRTDAGPGPASAVEMALWDLAGRVAGLPLCLLLGGRLREELELCACTGIRDPADAAEAAFMCVERWGFTTLKTKAGRSVEEDLCIAAAILAAVGERAVLRPDANEGYNPREAERALRGMAALGGIQYFEDPCSARHLEALARFRREIPVPIAVNMGIGAPASLPPIAAAGAADVVMPDTTSAGGILRVRQAAAAAEALGLPCVMHCSHDLGLKTAAVAHLYASTLAFTLPADTTYHGLTGDVLAEPFRVRDGRVPVPAGPGLGVQVDPEMLRKYRADG